MHKTIAGLGAVAVVLTGSGAFAQQTCDNLVGTWGNQNPTSTMTIEKADKTSVSGKYVSGKAKGTLVGWVNQKASAAPAGANRQAPVAFSVRWDEYGSITSWTGYCTMTDKGPKLFTVWNLVRPDSDFEWDHILTGSDTFTPKAAETAQDPKKPDPKK